MIAYADPVWNEEFATHPVYAEFAPRLRLEGTPCISISIFPQISIVVTLRTATVKGEILAAGHLRASSCDIVDDNRNIAARTVQVRLDDL